MIAVKTGSGLNHVRLTQLIREILRNGPALPAQPWRGFRGVCFPRPINKLIIIIYIQINIDVFI